MSWLSDAERAGVPGVADTFAKVAASRGWVSNLLRSLGHAPDALARFSALGHYGRYGTELSELQRELVIVITGRHVAYAWAHHAPLARLAGVTDPQLDAIRADRTPPDLPPAERALCDLVFALTAMRGVARAQREAALAHFSERQITDITMLTAYYAAAATVIVGLDVAVEPPEVLQIELDWQRRPRDPATGQVIGDARARP
ncbi:MAG: carboxymuconolactone decarboxylase family protein [Lautropia sp.]